MIELLYQIIQSFLLCLFRGNKTQINPQTQGGIWSEIICQHPETASAVETFKRGECNGFNGRIFNLPQISLHIKVTGRTY
jgi:hypothetical protein